MERISIYNFVPEQKEIFHLREQVEYSIVEYGHYGSIMAVPISKDTFITFGIDEELGFNSVNKSPNDHNHIGRKK